MADLITVEEARAYMARSGASAPNDPTLLQMLVSGASEAIARYLQRELASGAREQVTNGAGGIVTTLREWPVTAVASVSVDGIAIPESTAEGEPGFTFDEIAVYLRGHYRFTRGVRNVRIGYTAGYATIPADVKLACAEIVTLRHKERDWIGIASKGLAGETVSFTQYEMPLAARQVLDRYRRVFAR